MVVIKDSSLFFMIMEKILLIQEVRAIGRNLTRLEQSACAVFFGVRLVPFSTGMGHWMYANSDCRCQEGLEIRLDNS